MLHGLRTIAAACEQFPDVARSVLGVHVEGPFLSELDGYRGAHPAAAIRDPSWPLFEGFQQAARGRISIVTLAPERNGAIEFIRRATESGIVVALGHTAASGSVIRDAVAAAASQHAPGEWDCLGAAAAPESDLGAGGDRRSLRIVHCGWASSRSSDASCAGEGEGARPDDSRQ